mmetsp:Transcript_53518/g.116669  ORF Transcript_53518/g.116669 Transcript_53518/m.116669 type:complete len:369 (-) Transcript_53518:440-1546(-)
MRDGSLDASASAEEGCSWIQGVDADGSPCRVSAIRDADQVAVSSSCDAGIADCTPNGEGPCHSSGGVHLTGVANGHAAGSSIDVLADENLPDVTDPPVLSSTSTEVVIAPIEAHAPSNDQSILVPNFQIHPSYPIEMRDCSTALIGGRPNTRVPAAIPPEKWILILKKLEQAVEMSYLSPCKQLHDGFVCCALVILFPPSFVCFFDEVFPCIFHSPGDRAVRKLCHLISHKDLAGLGVEIALTTTKPLCPCGTRKRRLEIRPISVEENTRRAEAAGVPIDPGFKAPSAVEIERELAGQCRICLDEESEPVLISPCECTGGMHRECLVRWQQHKLKARRRDDHAPSVGIERCEICRAPWKFVIPQLQEE